MCIRYTNPLLCMQIATAPARPLCERTSYLVNVALLQLVSAYELLPHYAN